MRKNTLRLLMSLTVLLTSQACSKKIPPPASIQLKLLDNGKNQDVFGEQVVMATVLDAQGRPMEHERVEWRLTSDSVGDIIAVDPSEPLWRKKTGSLKKRARKEAIETLPRSSGRYAVTYTKDQPNTLEAPPELLSGSTFIVITSGTEGLSQIYAFAPRIADWDSRTAMVERKWNDAVVYYPPDSENRYGEPHEIALHVNRISSGAPITDYMVRFEIQPGGPAAYFEWQGPDGATQRGETAIVRPGVDGIARATLHQVQPEEGVNVIKASVSRPDEICCRLLPDLEPSTFRKTWVSPKIAVSKSAPEAVGVNSDVDYEIVVRNVSSVEAREVRIEDVIPDSMRYVSSVPVGQRNSKTLLWEIGTLAAGATRTIRLTTQANRMVAVENCAVASCENGRITERDCKTVQVAEPALGLKMFDLQDLIRVGEHVEYQIEVTNQGLFEDEDIVVTAYLPDALSYVSSSGPFMESQTLEPPAAVAVQGQIIQYSLPSLAVNETAVFRLRGRADYEKIVIFKVHLKTKSTDLAGMEGFGEEEQTTLCTQCPSKEGN